MNAIVTICNGSYEPLLAGWYRRIRSITELPIYVLALHDTHVQSFPPGDHIILVNEAGNPFPTDTPDHACAEKLRIFQNLPFDVSEVLFLDIDVLALGNFWDGSSYFDTAKTALVACQDIFVGYKEKMEAEFRPFDPNFRMIYYPDGSFHYFNTGVFFASRSLHALMFERFLSVWKEYVKKLGGYPSIFDQNVVNYCLIREAVRVERMPIQNNCLRQYGATVSSRQLWLNGAPVNAYHFNGGTAKVKLARWLELEKKLEESQ